MTGLLWRSFQDVYDEVFVDAVTHIVATRPARHKPPLLTELSEAVDAAKVRANQQRYNKTGSVYETLEDAAKNNKTADPEFVQACLKLVRDFLDRKVTRKQFDEGCDLIASVAKQLNPSCERRTATPYRATAPSYSRYRTGEKNDD